MEQMEQKKIDIAREKAIEMFMEEIPVAPINKDIVRKTFKAGFNIGVECYKKLNNP